MKYRPEIDGLRAIAIISVVMYHAEVVVSGQSWFAGGFFGVDIFFVISGYLISRIILSELYETGSFSFPDFYERRARRILPMLFTVILASFPFAWRLLLPDDFQEFCSSIISAVFFGSNYFFYLNATQYGADSALLKPFLHTWSLGIEEQFYIIFPVLLLGIYRRQRKHLFTLCVAMLLLSFSFSAYMSLNDADLNFYLPTSRAWELLTGSVLAYVELKRGRVQHSSMSQFLPVVGLALISFSLFYFDSNTPHPGFATLLPVVGVALIIGFSSGAGIVDRLLGSQPLVGIGLISYSAYLWHYPIFAFSRIGDSAPGIYDKIWWIFLTLVLSIASYFWIERPFRNRQFLRGKLLLTGLTTVFLLVGGLQLASSNYSTGARVEAFMPAILTHEDFLQRPWTSLRQDGTVCFDNRCVFRNDSSSTWVQLLGDSHMASLQSDLLNRLENRANVVSWTRGGCWPVSGESRERDNRVIYGICSEDHQRQRFSDIMSVRNSTIVFSARLPLYLSRYGFDNREGGIETFIGGENLYHEQFKTKEDIAAFRSAVVDSITRLLDGGHTVILVYPIPEVGWKVPRKIMADMPSSLPDVGGWLRANPVTTSYDVYLERSREAFEIFDGIAHENLHKVYPHRLFCDNQIEGRCVTHDDEHLFYADEGHPSYKGAEMINDQIMAAIENSLGTAAN